MDGARCRGARLTLLKVSRTHQHGSSSWILMVAMVTTENPSAESKKRNTAAGCRVGTEEEEEEEERLTHIKTQLQVEDAPISYWQINGTA